MGELNSDHINFSEDQREFFETQGYLVCRQMIPKSLFQEILQDVDDLIKSPVEPYELEASLQYEGAPKSVDADGGQTIRRFLTMHQRHDSFKRWFSHSLVMSYVKPLLNSDEIYMVAAHHNSLMTKQPKYSSSTNWHRDVRYWNYQEENLINVWLALGDEHAINGGLKVIPQTHNMSFDANCYDEKLFFRKDAEQNQEVLSKAIDVNLNAGDVLIFHSRLLHAANANKMQTSKNSLVFSYRASSNLPIEGTRSDSNDDVKL